MKLKNSFRIKKSIISTKRQKALCKKYGSNYVPIDKKLYVGIDLDTQGLLPINALRHPAQGTTNGWYIWFGEKFSTKEDWFKPTCIDCLPKYLDNDTINLLALEPGFRFLKSKNYLDIWFDKTLLEIN
jgi:hypothetical protein